PRAETNGARVANREWLTGELARILATKGTEAWVALLGQADVPCGPVNTVDRMLDDPHVAGLDLITTFDRGAGETRVVGSPLHFSGAQRRRPQPPPALGEHTESVLRELLDLGPSQ